MSKPLMLDLFCGAGGCAAGYVRAGFDVTGIDHRPQLRYLHSGASAFIQADALEYVAAHGQEYDVIHASPPCQRYSKVNRMAHLAGKEYPDLLASTRDLLERTDRLWVIENVLGAPLQSAALVCGSAFGLAVRRHRYFESSVLLMSATCRHGEQDRDGPRFPTAFRDRNHKQGQRRQSTVVQVYGHTAGKVLWPEAMGIDWMTSRELTQAIPPRYTEFVGLQLLRALEGA